MFRTVPLSIIRSFSLYTQQWYMSYRLCWQLASRIKMESILILLASCQQTCMTYHCCVQWKTPDDGQRNCPKHVEFYSKNKSDKLVHLVGLIIRTYHDARSPERQIQALIAITRALPPGCTMLYYMLDAQLLHNPQLTSHTEHSWCSTASLTSKQTSQRTRESHALRVMHAGREPTSHSSVLPCHPQTLWMVINPYPKDIKHLTFSMYHFKTHICYGWSTVQFTCHGRIMSSLSAKNDFHLAGMCFPICVLEVKLQLNMWPSVVLFRESETLWELCLGRTSSIVANAQILELLPHLLHRYEKQSADHYHYLPSWAIWWWEMTLEVCVEDLHWRLFAEILWKDLWIT